MTLFRITKLASGGLYLSGPDDQLPEGFMRHYRGVSPIAVNSALSRDGAAQLFNLNAHSAVYFSGMWHLGVSTSFYQESTEIKTGLSGDRLSFSKMAPVAGIVDYLFVAGGGELFKVDSNGDATHWGIAPPDSMPTLVDGGAGGSLDDGAIYKYSVTFLNSLTGHRSNGPEPGDLAITADFKLLLHCDGSNGSTSFEDSIGTHTVTANGDAQISTSQKKFGSGSGLFDSSGDYLSIPDHADFNLAAGDFTITFWLRTSSSVNGGIFCQYDDADNTYYAYKTTTTHAYVFHFGVRNAASQIATLEMIIPVVSSAWHHFAIVRTGNDWYLFVDGVLRDSDSNAGSVPDLAGSFLIGRTFYPATYDLDGWMDEFCLIKGTAFWTSGFTVPDAPFGGNEIDLAGGSTSVDLSDIPQSSDDQVDTIELWRTVGGGAVYFKLVELAHGTTSYTDNISDASLLSLELPTDNIEPYSWFDDCYGPWNGSMFWITRSEEGERGRLYYSPIGRAESMEGFIEVTSDDDGLQRIESYAGNLIILSKSRAFQIYGTNPYYSREIAGVPGTIAPHTLVVTPIGPLWESQDGPRVFSGGAQAPRIAYDQIKPIFRGKSIGTLGSFTGVIATFARGEYIVSDGTYTLALDIEKLTWRELGIGCAALAYSPETDQIAATLSSKVVDLEKEGETDDNNAAIAYNILTPAFNPGMPFSVELIRIDANANGETLTCYAYIDGSSLSQGNLTTTAGRRWNEFDLNARLMNRLAIAVTGSISDIVEVFEIQCIYWPTALKLQINDQEIEIPGRLAGDRQTLTFESFEDTQLPIGAVYRFERFFYDIDANSNSITFTLNLINETAVSLGSISGADRDVNEIQINKKGRFDKLVLAGDFTQAIVLRRLELVATAISARK